VLKDVVEVLLVDDHVLVRETLAERLRREPGIVVVGVVGTADEAITAAIETSPDVILLDIDMPGIISFDAVRTISAFNPATRVVFLSGYVRDSFLDQALAVQARGYLTKWEPPDTIVAAVLEVASGGTYYSGAVRARLAARSGGTTPTAGPRSRTSDLTSRELQVLTYIARGLPKKEIGRIMHVSIKTVEAHAQRVMNKLGVHDRVQLARLAIREGLVNA
jgi:DNA-binding NarL/FixJ family response regulator